MGITAFYGLLLLAAVTSCTAAQTNTDARTIAALREEWVHDLEGKLLDQSTDLYTEDAVFFNPGGPRVDGRPAIRALFATVTNSGDADIHLHSTGLAVSGTLAYDGGNYDETIIEQKTKAKMVFRGCYLMVLQRGADGRRRIHQHVWTKNAPSKEDQM